MSSSDFTSLRGMYPGILSITRADVNRLCSETHDPAMRLWLESIYEDVQRAKKRTQLKGWSHGYDPFARNPFMAMDLTNWGPDISDDVLEATHEVIVRANSWWGVGVWTLAEEYFQKALFLAFRSNNVLAALQVGANLGLCYVAAGDQDNALRMVNQALPAAIQIQNWYTVHRMGTIKRICLARAGRWDLVTVETQKLRGITHETDLASLDESAFEIVADIYQFTDDRHRLQAWKDEWSKLGKKIKYSVPKEKLTSTQQSHSADEAFLLLQRGDQLFANGQIEEAIQVFERIVQNYRGVLNSQQLSTLLTALGNVCLRIDRRSQALSAFEQAIQVLPDAVLAWYGAGQCHYLNKNFDHAITAFERAWKVAPTFWLARYFLAESFYWADRYSAAANLLYDFVEEMQKGTLRDNSGRECHPHPRPYTILAACEIFEMDFFAAQFHLWDALKINSDYEDAKILLASLGTIQTTGDANIALDFPFVWRAG